jgi:ankyrin repeat protein
LVKAGHQIDFEDIDKFTPLFSAISSHAERSLRLLVHYGANLKHKTIKNETSVFIAAKYGHLKIIQILIE